MALFPNGAIRPVLPLILVPEVRMQTMSPCLEFPHGVAFLLTRTIFPPLGYRQPCELFEVINPYVHFLMKTLIPCESLSLRLHFTAAGLRRTYVSRIQSGTPHHAADETLLFGFCLNQKRLLKRRAHPVTPQSFELQNMTRLYCLPSLDYSASA